MNKKYLLIFTVLLVVLFVGSIGSGYTSNSSPIETTVSAESDHIIKDVSEEEKSITFLLQYKFNSSITGTISFDMNHPGFVGDIAPSSEQKINTIEVDNKSELSVRYKAHIKEKFDNAHTRINTKEIFTPKPEIQLQNNVKSITITEQNFSINEENVHRDLKYRYKINMVTSENYIFVDRSVRQEVIGYSINGGHTKFTIRNMKGIVNILEGDKINETIRSTYNLFNNTTPGKEVNVFFTNKYNNYYGGSLNRRENKKTLWVAEWRTRSEVGQTLPHELVHASQEYSVGEQMEWWIEGSANYLGGSLNSAINGLRGNQKALNDTFGEMTYTNDEVLTKPDTWGNTLVDYSRGSQVVSYIDSQLMKQTDGEYNIVDLHNWMNTEDHITYEMFINKIDNFVDQETIERMKNYLNNPDVEIPEKYHSHNFHIFD